MARVHDMTSEAGGRREQPRSLRLAFALLAPLVFVVGAASLRVHWSHSRLYPLRGDEYKYPIVGRSLWVFHSVDVQAAYRDTFRKHLFIDWGPHPSLAAAGTGVAKTARGYFSAHGLGLPFVLGPAVWLHATPGSARAVMVCIALAVPVLAYLALRFEGCSPALSSFLAIALGASAPLLANSSQLYPDMPGGVIAAAALLVILRRTKGVVERAPVRYIALAFVAFMPWLHIRFLLPSVILTGALIWLKRKASWRSTALESIPFVLSAVMLFAYNLYAFGSIFGWYSSSGKTQQAGWMAFQVFIGLNVDRFQGLFVQQPFLLFAIAGTVLLFRRARSVGLLVVALDLAFLVPNALHPNWYGGASFAGRFGLSAAIVLVIPAAVALAELGRRWAAFTCALAAGAIALNAWMFTRVWHGDFVLLSGPPRLPRSISSSWLPLLDRSLPALNRVTWSQSFVPNYVVPIAVLTLATGCALIVTRRRRIGVGVVVVSLLAFVVPTASASPTVRQDAVTLRPGHIGQASGRAYEAKADRDAPGLLAIGPTFRMVPDTDWTISVVYSSSAPSSAVAGTFRLTTDRVTWCTLSLPGTNGRRNRIDVRWHHRQIHGALTMQVLFSGDGSMRLDDLALRRGLSPSAERCTPEPGAVHRYNQRHHSA